MHLTKKDKRLLLVLLGLVIFALAFFGLVKPFQEKTAELETQITALTKERDLLLTHHSRQDDYLEEMQKIGRFSLQELQRFSTDVRSEDLIMYANELQEKIGLQIGGLLVEPPQTLARLMLPPDVEGSGDLHPVVIMEARLQMSCALSYGELKQLINYINANPKKTSLGLVSASYSGEGGNLAAQLSISRYFLVTEAYEYTETQIPPVEKGSPDPFRVLPRISAG